MFPADEFALSPDVIYLNHAAVAPWPTRTAAAVANFAEENRLRGAQHYPAWLVVEQRLRERLQRLIGARSADEIALLKNTSEGLSVIAHGLDWRPGDNVIIPAQEFPSNRIVWESLAEYGVQVRAIDLYATDDPEAVLLQAINAHTRLMSVSAVQYDTGLCLDLVRLGRACEAAEVLFCVDAIQSLGALPLDVRAIRADFVVADGHKWLLGPEGLALFYCRRELLERLRLRQFGWHMVEHMGDFDRRDWVPARTARRFECGSPNMLGIYALEASLSLLEEFGIEQVADKVMGNTAYLIGNLELSPTVEIITPTAVSRHAGIVSFKPRTADVQALHRRLQAAGVVCAVRSGALRLSPHFYTPREHLERTLKLLDIH
ncbi:MAG: aminotransferase class V-fold PLP-dependent enzyme [Gammaproteobacteria bacterium]|nr:aminotransferase class V-fold PLP-dependent enzyme [Gammaproteobacteria bacterium]